MFSLKKFKRTSRIGPGIVTGASDDDPSGILTYLQAGTILGFKALWTTLFTLPLMYGVQEMCGRIGLVTRKGLTTLIKENYPRPVLHFISTISIVVIIINIGADLLAIGLVLESIFNITKFFWLPVSALFIILGVIFLSYKKFAGILKWLALSLVFYIIAAFSTDINWLEAVKHTFLPSVPLGKDSFLLISAILGTTISPYLFFWQEEEEVEEEKGEMERKSLTRFSITKKRLGLLARDTFSGMFISNLAAWFIILVATNLSQGTAGIENFDQASSVLQPLLGNFAYLIFGLGILGTGFLSIPVLASTVGYSIAETFNLREGINLKFLEAKAFYLTIALATLAGLLLTFTSVDPVKILIYTAVFYTIITPPLIWIILSIARNERIMKHKVNGAVSNILGYAALIVMTVSALGSLYFLLN